MCPISSTRALPAHPSPSQELTHREEDRRFCEIKAAEGAQVWSDLVTTVLVFGLNFCCDEGRGVDLPTLLIRQIKPLSWAAKLSKDLTIYLHAELTPLWRELDIVPDLEEMPNEEIAATLERYPGSFYWQKPHWYALPLIKCRTLYHLGETLLSSCYQRLCLIATLRLCREMTLLHLPTAEEYLSAALSSQVHLQCDIASASALSLSLRRSHSARAGVVLARHLQREKLAYLQSNRFRPLKSRALQALKKTPFCHRLPFLYLIYTALWPVRQIFQRTLQLLLALRRHLLNRLDDYSTHSTSETPLRRTSVNSSPIEAVQRAICRDPIALINTLARSTPSSSSKSSEKSQEPSPDREKEGEIDPAGLGAVESAKIGAICRRDLAERSLSPERASCAPRIDRSSSRACRRIDTQLNF